MFDTAPRLCDQDRAVVELISEQSDMSWILVAVRTRCVTLLSLGGDGMSRRSGCAGVVGGDVLISRVNALVRYLG
jgi:hypothetical protein